MPVKPILFENFSGGINTRDHPSALQENEFPDAKNVTVDERGHIVKRLGYVDRFNTTVGTGIVSNLFYWNTAGKLVSQVGTGVQVDGGSNIKTFTTADRAGFAEFNGILFMNHPVDGMFYWNGATITYLSSAPKGNAIATWKNRLWSNDSTSNSRLWFSAIGDPTTAWPGTNWIDLKEKDSAPITALGGAAGMDITGRPGLMVFKQDSSYRVYDSTTGAYTTIDPTIGCGSNIGLISAGGRTYCASTKGIFSTDGVAPMREDSQLITNFFEKTIINQTRPDLYAVGAYQDRLFFSFPYAGQTANSVVIELHPEQHWVMRHTNAASCYASFGQNVTDMVFGSTTNNRIFNSHKGGSDNGSAIASYMQTNWSEPNDGAKFRIRRLRVTGLGTFQISTLRDYATAGSDAALQVAITGADLLNWDAGEDWDEDHVWGPGSFLGHQDFWSIGVFRSLALRIDETSSLSSTGPTILGSTTTPDRGAWELSHVIGLAYDLGTY